MAIVTVWVLIFIVVVITVDASFLGVVLIITMWVGISFVSFNSIEVLRVVVSIVWVSVMLQVTIWASLSIYISIVLVVERHIFAFTPVDYMWRQSNMVDLLSRSLFMSLSGQVTTKLNISVGKRMHKRGIVVLYWLDDGSGSFDTVWTMLDSFLSEWNEGLRLVDELSIVLWRYDLLMVLW